MYSVLMADLSPKVENLLTGAGTTCQKHQGATIALLAYWCGRFPIGWRFSRCKRSSHPYSSPTPRLRQHRGWRNSLLACRLAFGDLVTPLPHTHAHLHTRTKCNNIWWGRVAAPDCVSVSLDFTRLNLSPGLKLEWRSCNTKCFSTIKTPTFRFRPGFIWEEHVYCHKCLAEQMPIPIQQLIYLHSSFRARDDWWCFTASAVKRKPLVMPLSRAAHWTAK